MTTARRIVVDLILGCLAAAIIFQAPLRWTASKSYRAFFSEQSPELHIYQDTAQAPVDLATFVTQTRRAWHQADVSTVHAAAVELATGLLYHSDIEVGATVSGNFVSWDLSPWQATKRIRGELGGQSEFLVEEGRYVFRRKTR